MFRSKVIPTTLHPEGKPFTRPSPPGGIKTFIPCPYCSAPVNRYLDRICSACSKCLVCDKNTKKCHHTTP